MNEVYGYIHKIIKFSAVDGPGNRSVIFLQGCNFNCMFCHNPETIPFKGDGVKKMTVAEVFDEIGTALNFIRGITVSGGEATLQHEFLTALFKAARIKGLTTFIDSNGSLDLESYPELMKYTDYVMLDIKSFDNEEHIKITGMPNTTVLKNMRFLAEKGMLFEVRTVISPNMLDCEKTVREVSKFIAPFKTIRYKLIKYRVNGVREEYIRQLKCPTKDFMEKMRSIALAEGVKDIVVL